MKKTVLILFLAVLLSLKLFAQNTSSEGVEFWATFPTHDPSQQGGTFLYANITIFVTSKLTSEVTVSCGTFSQTKSIPANTSVGFDVPRANAYIDFTEQNTNLSNRAIHIKVTDGKPSVAVYAHVYAGARSAATLLLPVESLGQKYYSMNYTQTINGTQDPPARNFVAIVAVEDNTDVIIRQKNGAEKKISLSKAGDVYEYMEGNVDDLTGTAVEVDSTTSACKRFAVFSGSTGLSIKCYKTRDPLFQQLYATNNWGRRYYVAPFSNRNYLIRILAKEDDTKVAYNGITKTLNKGQFLESETLTTAISIEADKSVSVAQYAFSQECAGLNNKEVFADPEMVILNPVELSIKEVTLFSSTKEKITERYLNVVMETAYTYSFKMNGSSNGINWTKVPSNEKYSYAQIPVSDDSINLKADVGFNAIAYGFGEYESYAYSAGTSLLQQKKIKVLNTNTEQELDGACVTQDSKLVIFTETKFSKIVWKIDGQPIITDLNPIPTSVIISGDKLYKYFLPTPVVFGAVGDYKAVLEADVLNMGGCFSRTEQYEFSFKVNELPKADFEIGAVTCSRENILFTDKSTSNLKIDRWIWDFGDGTNVVTQQNPSHLFANEGTYTVRFTAGLDGSCYSDVVEQKVTIFKTPQISFSTLNAVCENGEEVNLLPSVVENTGEPGNFTFQGLGVSGNVFNPKSANVGVHTISATFSTPNRCQSTEKQNIEVMALPTIKAGKTIYLAQGAPKKMKAFSSVQNATYKWTPSIGLDNDSVLNPTVAINDEMEYTLTAITQGNCVIVDKVWVKQQKEVELYNAFSPNGDGINDLWEIKNISHYENIVLQIFNRYGERVFVQKGDEIKPFDGAYKGVKLPFGTYFYTLTLEGGQISKSGSITILN